jgi:hypothetical protein
MDIEKLLTEENVGGWDLFVRAVIGAAGIVALSLGLIQLAEPWNWVLGLVLFIALFTGITRHCTPYSFLGISTARKK